MLQVISKGRIKNGLIIIAKNLNKTEHQPIYAQESHGF